MPENRRRRIEVGLVVTRLMNLEKETDKASVLEGIIAYLGGIPIDGEASRTVSVPPPSPDACDHWRVPPT